MRAARLIPIDAPRSAPKGRKLMTTHTFDRTLTVLKAALCVALTLSIHVFTPGCGESSLTFLLPQGDDAVTEPLDLQLSEALDGTQLRGATAVRFNLAEQTFALVFPDDQREVRGSYILYEGAFTITSLYVRAYGQSVTLDFDVHKMVTHMETSTGDEWTLDKTEASRFYGQHAEHLQSYVAANADLLATAERLDAAGFIPGVGFPGTTVGGGSASDPTGSGTSSKDSAALLAPLLLTLGTVALVVSAGHITSSLLAVFAIAAAVEVLVASRLAGLWDIAGAETVQTAAGVVGPRYAAVGTGWIGSLADAKTEWEVVDSRIEAAAGRNVQWRVVASVPVLNVGTGQSADVEVSLSFNVDEQMDGSLAGHLTMTVGQEVHELSITMTRR